MTDQLTPAESALRDAARDYHRLPTPGKVSVSPTKPLTNQRDLSLAYSPGVAYPCLDIAADPRPGCGLHLAQQPCRRRNQRHRGARPGRHRPAGRQAGDGGQGLPLQEIRRHRRVRHRAGRARPGPAHRHRCRARAHARRHEPRGHQGARVLLHRAHADRAHEHPGVPRRPARHGHHLGRGDPQRPRDRRQGHRQGQDRRLGRGRRGDRGAGPAREAGPRSRATSSPAIQRASSTRVVATPSTPRRRATRRTRSCARSAT